jgi:catechol 2,3-dioxygenase-like lactoylglutathione lyase family enzyme
MLSLMLTHFDRVLLAVEDHEAAVDHYSRLLGRGVSWRGETTDREFVSAVYRLRNMSLHLLSPKQKGVMASQLRQWMRDRGEGVCGLAFGTDNAARFAELLRSRGFATPDPVEGGGTSQGEAPAPRWISLLVPPSSTRGTMLIVTESLHEEEVIPIAPFGVEEAQSVQGLDHVVVSSSDLDASSRIYRELLGVRLAMDRSFEDRSLRILFFRIAGVTVEVVGALNEPPRTDEPDRFGGLAWQVGDVPAARERLGWQGFDVSEHRAGIKPGTRVCTVRSDTHGVPTLLIGPDPG